MKESLSRGKKKICASEMYGKLKSRHLRIIKWLSRSSPLLRMAVTRPGLHLLYHLPAPLQCHDCKVDPLNYSDLQATQSLR